MFPKKCLSVDLYSSGPSRLQTFFVWRISDFITLMPPKSWTAWHSGLVFLKDVSISFLHWFWPLVSFLLLSIFKIAAWLWTCVVFASKSGLDFFCTISACSDITKFYSLDIVNFYQINYVNSLICFIFCSLKFACFGTKLWITLFFY